jgi:hypothetical protein
VWERDKALIALSGAVGPSESLKSLYDPYPSAPEYSICDGRLAEAVVAVLSRRLGKVYELGANASASELLYPALLSSPACPDGGLVALLRSNPWYMLLAPLGLARVISSSCSSIRAASLTRSTQSCASRSVCASRWKFREGENRPKACFPFLLGSFCRATAVRSDRMIWCLSFDSEESR